MSFYEDIRIAINKHSMDALSNTPDYVLANLVIEAIMNFNVATKGRDKFFGIEDREEAPSIDSVYVTLQPLTSDPFFENTENPHITLSWYGKPDPETYPEFLGELEKAIKRVSEAVEPFTAKVSGHGILGPENTTVLFVEAKQIQRAKDLMDWLLPDAKTFPHYVPHISYKGADINHTPDGVWFNAIAAFVGYEDGTFSLIRRMHLAGTND